MKANARQEKRNQTVPELGNELRLIREKIFKLQWKRRAVALKNPLELRVLRRHAARIETWLKEREAGIRRVPGAN